MTSGIFLIGTEVEQGIFDKYVGPCLNKRELYVPDQTLVHYCREILSRKTPLISLQGDSLEQGLNDSLVEGFQLAVDSDPSLRNNLLYNQQLVNEYWIREPDYESEPEDKGEEGLRGVYQKIAGPFSDNGGASKLFTTIALNYWLDKVGQSIEDTKKRVRELSRKTLGDLAR